jgi:gamma-glutamylcyclotransferase (GGCT)/AIG2-like uncharacterized protein YtfP
MHWIFGYATLANVLSLKKSLNIKELECFDAHLDGYARHWNATHLPCEEDGRSFYYIDGSEYEGYLSFMNIVPCDEKKIYGVVFKVDNNLLDNIDDREFMYYRQRVTVKAENGKEIEAWVYLADDYAINNYDVANDLGNNAILKKYSDFISSTFINMDKLREYNSSFVDDEDFPTLKDLVVGEKKRSR